MTETEYHITECEHGFPRYRKTKRNEPGCPSCRRLARRATAQAKAAAERPDTAALAAHDLLTDLETTP